MIKLEGYQIIKKIGSGGMGDVYLAEHEKLEKKVAIKSLHKNLASDTTFRKRFSQEAKTHSKLDHPNIVKLLDYKEQKDGLFLIMEYVDGKQLDEHIKKVSGPIPEKDLTVLFTQILDAIGYAHKKGLVHRDVKPSNIMIDKEGRIKVLDFGIAKLQEEEKGLTKTGVQIGTASYMSPEQVNAEKTDKLTDIYSLGVTLFYMAVGKSPYDGETNTFSIQTKIVSDPFPVARDAYPGVSERFEQIIHKATQKKKTDRYQSCEDFKNDFDITRIISENNSIYPKHYVRKEGRNVEPLLKNINSNEIKISKFLFWASVILFISITAGLIYNIEEKSSAIEDSNRLLNQYSKLKSKLSGDNYDSGCNKRNKLKLHNHTDQDLRFHVSYKLRNGMWSSWLYWSIDSRDYTSGGLGDIDGKTVYTSDYRYYITTASLGPYLYSKQMPHITNTCNAKCINIY